MKRIVYFILTAILFAGCVSYNPSMPYSSGGKYLEGENFCLYTDIFKSSITYIPRNENVEFSNKSEDDSYVMFTTSVNMNVEPVIKIKSDLNMTFGLRFYIDFINNACKPQEVIFIGNSNNTLSIKLKKSEITYDKGASLRSIDNRETVKVIFNQVISENDFKRLLQFVKNNKEIAVAIYLYNETYPNEYENLIYDSYGNVLEMIENENNFHNIVNYTEEFYNSISSLYNVTPNEDVIELKTSTTVSIPVDNAVKECITE